MGVHMPEVSYDSLPAHMREGMRLYIEQGIEPGGFAMACLCNDLVGAVGCADYVNAAAMREWVTWLYTECPSTAWRTRAKVDAWMEARRAATEDPK